MDREQHGKLIRQVPKLIERQHEPIRKRQSGRVQGVCERDLFELSDLEGIVHDLFTLPLFCLFYRQQGIIADLIHIISVRFCRILLLFDESLTNALVCDYLLTKSCR